VVGDLLGCDCIDGRLNLAQRGSTVYGYQAPPPLKAGLDALSRHASLAIRSCHQKNC